MPSLHTFPLGKLALVAAGTVVVSLLVFALAVLLAGLAIGASLFILWRLLAVSRR